MLEFHDSAGILNWLVSFHIFHSCTILVYSICHAVSVMDILHCNLGELVWCTQVQSESQGFYFHVAVFSRETWLGNSCFAFHRKSLGFKFFHNLFSQQFKVWLKHSQDVYLIFVLYFHVACNCYSLNNINIMTYQSKEKNIHQIYLNC